MPPIEQAVVKEYFHQAVAFVWAGGETPWPIGWELLQLGEGGLTAALRLLERLLPQLRKSADLVMGDALYCCRPFFTVTHANGLKAFATSLTSGKYRVSCGSPTARTFPPLFRWFMGVMPSVANRRSAIQFDPTPR